MGSIPSCHNHKKIQNTAVEIVVLNSFCFLRNLCCRSPSSPQTNIVLMFSSCSLFAAITASQIFLCEMHTLNILELFQTITHASEYSSRVSNCCRIYPHKLVNFLELVLGNLLLFFELLDNSEDEKE